ncbi:MAG: glycoside hydrolase family 97 catalytic domain-containing protein [Phycisphaeraceae bacterium]|nr:MAG: glycoside hydrolase family 97 catalytic domain-containing protein [Phycisphaeraceae bacterium]
MWRKESVAARWFGALVTLVLIVGVEVASAGAPSADVGAKRSVPVASPDGRVVATFSLDGEGGPGLFYRVSFDGQPVLLESRLSLSLQDDLPLAGPFEFVEIASRDHDETWRPACGERAEVRDHYREVVIDLREKDKPGRLWRVTCRAYDDGVAFCSTIPVQPALDHVTIGRENTEFRLPPESVAYVARHAQGECEPVKLAEFTGEAERPLTIALPDGRFASIGEAKLVDYARMRLAAVEGRPGALVSSLAGPVTLPLPATTPWRVVMVAESPGELLEHNDLFRNLNDPCAIADTSWIRPGKVIRVAKLSTECGIACVDFASARNLQYIELDAGWYGAEFDETSDATTVTVDPKRNPTGDLDLPRVLEYAASKDIGVILYVNRKALTRQLDEILPLYHRWGVRGVKFGFVDVGSQQATRWLHDAIKKAAANELMVDVHDEYRPTGFERTYPNLMTVEGIRGNEEMPPASQNLMLPFTRYLCGPGDYTICYYFNYTSSDPKRRVQTTPAHQLALSVAFYSPWEFLFWYDRPEAYQGEPEIEFFERVPTTWDDTRVIQGEIGGFITVARRSGDDWFVGTLNNEEPRGLSVPLRFLDESRIYVASIYEDGPVDAFSPFRTNVQITRRLVTSETVLTADLHPSGGQAVRLAPAFERDLEHWRGSAGEAKAPPP